MTTASSTEDDTDGDAHAWVPQSPNPSPLTKSDWDAVPESPLATSAPDPTKAVPVISLEVTMKQQMMALAMAYHPRLGADSAVRLLPADVFLMVAHVCRKQERNALLIEAETSYRRERYHEAGLIFRHLHSQHACPVATAYIAQMRADGLGFKRSESHAIAMYHRALSAGLQEHVAQFKCASASFVMGMVLLLGSCGQTSDEAAAVKLLIYAAKKEHAEACNYLGDVYCNGYGGVQVDMETARSWWEKAAKGGSKGSEDWLRMSNMDQSVVANQL